jgi:hypothetical protein
MSRAVLFTSGMAAFFAVVISGCVVPVAPKWSDPASNYPPTIASASPPVGTLLGGLDGGSVEVAVELADQNVGDKLYLRWIIDYQPGSTNIVAVETFKPGGDSIVRTPELFVPNCNADHLTETVSDHWLMLAVSDRPFLNEDPSGPNPDQVPTGNYLVQAAWPFVMSCQ